MTNSRVFFSFIAIFVLFALPLVVSAETVVQCSSVAPWTPFNGQSLVPCGEKVECPCEFVGLIFLAENLINFGVFIAIPLSAVAFAWAGVLYITAAGNQGQIGKARGIFTKVGIGLIIVDYLQLMAPTNTKASDSMTQQVTEISRSLKTMARELEVPVIALSQLSRAIEQRRGKPRLSDLRDSGSIEQDADVVMFIHREDKMNDDSEKTNIAEILVEKHRNGPVGKVDLYFDEKRVTFNSIDKSNFGDFAETEETSVDADF